MSRERRYSIAVAFDGVIHRYSKGWHDGTIYDEPIDGAREALARIHRRYEVVIFTTRVNPDLHGAESQIVRIHACGNHSVALVLCRPHHTAGTTGDPQLNT